MPLPFGQRIVSQQLNKGFIGPQCSSEPKSHYYIYNYTEREQIDNDIILPYVDNLNMFVEVHEIMLTCQMSIISAIL